MQPFGRNRHGPKIGKESPGLRPTYVPSGIFIHNRTQDNTTTTTVLRPFVRDYPGEPVPEETLTHPPS